MSTIDPALVAIAGATLGSIVCTLWLVELARERQLAFAPIHAGMPLVLAWIHLGWGGVSGLSIHTLLSFDPGAESKSRRSIFLPLMWASAAATLELAAMLGWLVWRKPRQ